MANFNFKKFNNPLKVVPNGTASLNDGNLRLTGDGGNNAGSAFYFEPITLKGKTSFKSSFQFRIHGGDLESGADGIAFILQNDPRETSALGGSGHRLGYEDISSSVAIEFDTYAWLSSEPNDNHIGLNLNGSLESKATGTPNVDLNSGEVLNAWINYNGKNNKLNVFLSDSGKKPKKPTLSTIIDVSDVVGDKAYVGFSGATGGLGNIHDILKWEFSTSDGNTSKPTKGIEGDDKNNRLEGTKKGDLIDGQNGNDTLIGAAGNDTLTGGGGADDFLLGSGKVYNKKDLGIDKITDFQPNADDIILDTETFITLKSQLGEGFSIGREFEVVKNKRAVAGSTADIVYDSSKGDLYYNPNSALPGFGGGGKIATLEGAPKISASDFVLE